MLKNKEIIKAVKKDDEKGEGRKREKSLIVNTKDQYYCKSKLYFS